MPVLYLWVLSHASCGANPPRSVDNHLLVIQADDLEVPAILVWFPFPVKILRLFRWFSLWIYPIAFAIWLSHLEIPVTLLYMMVFPITWNGKSLLCSLRRWRFEWLSWLRSVCSAFLARGQFSRYHIISTARFISLCSEISYHPFASGPGNSTLEYMRRFSVSRSNRGFSIHPLQETDVDFLHSFR